MLRIAKNHKTLEKDGNPFFYLADTCWSAFTNISEEEWEYYLYKRKAQGFNTIQINILPQWDASDTDLNYNPFIDNNPYQINMDYFKHAYQMCKKAKEYGFELALVVLWCNYVPHTWASKMMKDDILPFDCLENYVNVVHETFTSLNPIYIISGDTDFPEKETEDYYIAVARQLRSMAKNCLFTTHIKGRYSYIPEELLECMDLCFYQSGHNAKDLSMPYSLAGTMQEKYPDKPVINSEPCYEQMGYSGGMYGRWTREDVRRAAYVSILSGACAGITYGAAGIYSWHKVDKGFMTKLGEGFDTPKSYQEAMNFPGAWDYGYLKEVMEAFKVNALTARQDLLLNKTEDIRVAEDEKGTILVYVQHNTKVRFNCDLSGYTGKAIDLENRFVSQLNINKNGIEMHPFNQDALYILWKGE